MPQGQVLISTGGRDHPDLAADEGGGGRAWASPIPGGSAGEGKDRSGPHLGPVTQQFLPKPWEPAGVALSQVRPIRNPTYRFLRSGAKLLLDLGTGFAAKWQVWAGGHAVCREGERRGNPRITILRRWHHTAHTSISVSDWATSPPHPLSPEIVGTEGGWL